LARPFNTIVNARNVLLAALTVLAIVGLSQSARSQIWPQKPVKIIVPFAPGGNSDGIARLIAQPLGDAFGQQFVVENRPAAVGAVAAEAVARSSADGHMLLMGSPSQIAILPQTTKLRRPTTRSKILLPSASLGPIRTFWSSILAYRRIRLLNLSTMPVAAPTNWTMWPRYSAA
jgi:tripartite-type tricarboxylate transporter receptor subunit TctC